MANNWYENYFKRLFDVGLSISLLLVLSPVIAIVSTAVLIVHGLPILFSQQRPGLNESPFNLLKFRSMTSDKDEHGHLLPNDLRTTKFGLFLRKTSLDELPSLINVVKGEMSFIGPRPLLLRYLPYYTNEQRARHKSRPGITGLAQVLGRNSISWEDKLSYDVHYVSNITLLLDIKILLKTLGIVFLRSGINDGETDIGMIPLDLYLQSKSDAEFIAQHPSKDPLETKQNAGTKHSK